MSSFNVKWRHHIKNRFVLMLANICNSVLTGKPAHTEKVVIKCFTNVFAIINITMLFPLLSPGSSHNVFYLQRQNVNNLHCDRYNKRSERVTLGRLWNTAADKKLPSRLTKAVFIELMQQRCTMMSSLKSTEGGNLLLYTRTIHKILFSFCCLWKRDHLLSVTISVGLHDC